MKKQDTEKRKTCPLPSPNAVRGGPSPPCSPELAANLKAEFNPSESDGVLEKSPCISFTAEENDMRILESVLEIHEREKWRRSTLAVSTASLGASVIFSAASFFGSVTTNSSSVLASALDTLLAVFSASVVIWRFRDHANGKIIGPKREKCGSIAFGIAFTVNGLVTIIVSCFYLTDETRTKHSDLLWPVLIGFSVTYCILAIIEFWISKSFQSSVLVSLCIDDALTSGLMLGLAISSLFLDQYPSVWYLDHTVAIVLAVVICACGVKILFDIFVYRELPFQVSR